MKVPGKVLYSSRRIQTRISELAKEISQHYEGKPLTVIGLMNGSLFFLVDLLRLLPAQTQMECWSISSYKGKSSTGKLHGLGYHRNSYHGRHVLIVDDILDTGLTLHEVEKHLYKLGAPDIKICVLLSKKKERAKIVDAKWVGFNMNNEFVIGYGLDLDQSFRSLPMIRVLPS